MNIEDAKVGTVVKVVNNGVDWYAPNEKYIGKIGVVSYLYNRDNSDVEVEFGGVSSGITSVCVSSLNLEVVL